jgi:dynein heavy chain 1, cytosolic
MSQMRDLPPIAGTIIWARQIECQLLTYMKHVKEDVLGKGWELSVEGQTLQSENAFQPIPLLLVIFIPPHHIYHQHL